MIAEIISCTCSVVVIMFHIQNMGHLLIKLLGGEIDAMPRLLISTSERGILTGILVVIQNIPELELYQ